MFILIVGFGARPLFFFCIVYKIVEIHLIQGLSLVQHCISIITPLPILYTYTHMTHYVYCEIVFIPNR